MSNGIACANNSSAITPQAAQTVGPERVVDYQQVQLPEAISSNTFEAAAEEKLYRLLKNELPATLRHWLAQLMDKPVTPAFSRERIDLPHWIAARDEFETFSNQLDQDFFDEKKIESSPQLKKVLLQYLGMYAAAKSFAVWEAEQIKSGKEGVGAFNPGSFQTKAAIDAFYEQRIFPAISNAGDYGGITKRQRDACSDFAKGALWPWMLCFKNKVEQISFLESELDEQKTRELFNYALKWDSTKAPELTSVAANIKAEEDARAAAILAKQRDQVLQKEKAELEKKKAEEQAIKEKIAESEARRVIWEDIQKTFPNVDPKENQNRFDSVLAPQNEIAQWSLIDKVTTKIFFSSGCITALTTLCSLAKAIWSDATLLQWPCGWICLSSLGVSALCIFATAGYMPIWKKAIADAKGSPFEKVKNDILNEMAKNPAYADKLMEVHKAVA